MRIEPYLFFNGRSEEAIDLYQRIFGAEVNMLMRYRESPEAPPMSLPQGWEDKVMHAGLTIGESRLMASDGCGGEAPGFQGFSLSVEMPDADSARRVFDALADGGEVQMPIGETFFSPCFGIVSDRFGLSWMIIVNP